VDMDDKADEGCTVSVRIERMQGYMRIEGVFELYGDVSSINPVLAVPKVTVALTHTETALLTVHLTGLLGLPIAQLLHSLDHPFNLLHLPSFGSFRLRYFQLFRLALWRMMPRS
jgi:hypothetical protein